MEEIRNAALAYFQTGSEEFKKMASTFFKMLGEAGSLTIGHLEEFLKERGFEAFHPDLLKDLGKDPGDHLDQTDAFLLYYVAVTRRPYCAVCDTFLKATYFACMDCFDHGNKTYNLCTDCFRKRKVCGHGHAVVLDNYAALQAKSHQAKELNPPAMNISSSVLSDPKKKACHDMFGKMEVTYFDYKNSHPNGGVKLVGGGVNTCNIG